MAEKTVFIYLQMFDGIIEDVTVSENFETVKKLWERDTKLSWEKFQALDIDRQREVIPNKLEGTTIYETKILS